MSEKDDLTQSIFDTPGTQEPLAPAAPTPDTDADRSSVDRRKAPRGLHPQMTEQREPVVRETAGYRMRLEPPDLAELRELPGSKGKTDLELGEQFLESQASRFVASLAGDVATPAEVRVLVDPYSRQAFLVVGHTIRGIVSF